MTSYREIFPKRNTFLAVIHSETPSQVMINIETARDNGADGVFLINHSISPLQLISIYASAKMAFPDFWMGMNMLGIDPVHVLEHMPDNEGGLWVDNAGISESSESRGAIEFATRRLRRPNWRGLYFGGVAFKYQETVRDPAHVAMLAMPYVDIITTSGDRTGHAPSLEKIRAMKMAIGTHPLAIASGITPENVHTYRDWADCFLVATGVSHTHTELDPRRVRLLADILVG